MCASEQVGWAAGRQVANVQLFWSDQRSGQIWDTATAKVRGCWAYKGGTGACVQWMTALTMGTRGRSGVCGRRQELSTYHYTAPAVSASLSSSFLFVVTEAGLETWTLRNAVSRTCNACEGL
jgi:hypothetical protein